jgi:hypothetical protein
VYSETAQPDGGHGDRWHTGPISFILSAGLPDARVVVTLFGSAVFMSVMALRYSAFNRRQGDRKRFLIWTGDLLIALSICSWSGFCCVLRRACGLSIVASWLSTHSLVDWTPFIDFLFYNRETPELRAQLRHLANGHTNGVAWKILPPLGRYAGSFASYG